MDALTRHFKSVRPLDALDYGGAPRASLALACHPALTSILELEEVCLSGIESLAAKASAEFFPLPGYVLKAVENIAYGLRRAACVESKGVIGGRLSIHPGECLAETTETPPAAA